MRPLHWWIRFSALKMAKERAQPTIVILEQHTPLRPRRSIASPGYEGVGSFFVGYERTRPVRRAWACSYLDAKDAEVVTGRTKYRLMPGTYAGTTI